jgi:hypothetical protein
VPSYEDSKNTLYCSFCGKSQHYVKKLIAGPTVFICDECVVLCVNIMVIAVPNEHYSYTLEDFLRELFVLRETQSKQPPPEPEPPEEQTARLTAVLSPTTSPP